jgi:hypothetical protein
MPKYKNYSASPDQLLNRLFLRFKLATKEFEAELITYI